MSTGHKQIEQRLEVALAELPTKKLKQLADFAEYLKSREEWEATRELMNDPAMREDVEEGRAQAVCGEGRQWRKVHGVFEVRLTSQAERACMSQVDLSSDERRDLCEKLSTV